MNRYVIKLIMKFYLIWTAACITLMCAVTLATMIPYAVISNSSDSRASNECSIARSRDACVDICGCGWCQQPNSTIGFCFNKKSKCVKGQFEPANCDNQSNILIALAVTCGVCNMTLIVTAVIGCFIIKYILDRRNTFITL